MRISTAHAYDATVERLTQRQTELSDAQYRITTGKRVLRASDDPIAAARAERALADISRAGAGLRSVEASRAAMTQLEGGLGDAVELLQRVREALVAGGDAAYDDGQRKALGEQIRGLREELFAVANRGDGVTGYLFGGQGSSAPPFLDAAGGVRYVGTRGETSADRAGGLPMTIDGALTWLMAPTGNGVFETRSLTSTGSATIDAGSVTDPAAITGASYQLQFSVALGVTTYSVLKDGLPTATAGAAFVAGQPIQIDGMAVTVSGAPADGDAFELAPSTPTLSVFDALDKAAADLATPLRSVSARTQAAAENLRNLDSVLARMTTTRATAGTALSRIDSNGEQLDTDSYNGKVERSVAEDLDMVAAISEFQNKQTGYQAALQTYASVQRMSLFDYIKT